MSHNAIANEAHVSFRSTSEFLIPKWWANVSNGSICSRNAYCLQIMLNRWNKISISTCYDCTGCWMNPHSTIICFKMTHSGQRLLPVLVNCPCFTLLLSLLNNSYIPCLFYYFKVFSRMCGLHIHPALIFRGSFVQSKVWNETIPALLSHCV